MFRRFFPLAAAVAITGILLGASTEPATVPSTNRAATKPNAGPADVPTIKFDRNKIGEPSKEWAKRHEENVALAKKGGIDLYFEGDSITDHWHDQGKEVFAREFAGWNAANFGIGGDRTQHVLWRLENGELDGVTAKVFVLMIGCNNSHANTPEEVAAGITAIVKKLREKQPQAKILLLAIFPRGKKIDDPDRQANEAANKLIAKLDDGKNVKYLDIGSRFLGPERTPTLEVMWDYAHPTEKGYQIWADAIKPVLTEWLGPPKQLTN